ncbi:MAG: hypothetical protein IPJ50_01000 [Betaproteobacteria bacterium]|nr:hypothetical protein [Betaproteobacteria bacterium]
MTWRPRRASTPGGDALWFNRKRLTDFAQGRRLGQNDHAVEWPLPQRPKWQSGPMRIARQCCAPEVVVDGRILITTPARPQGSDARNWMPLALRWNQWT